MSDCSQTPFEFIQDAFSPQVAVLCSHDAELVCKKNNLSFVELTQPFCRLTTEAHIRDPGGVSHTIRNLKLSMKDIHSGPPQPTLARKMLSDAVANALPSTFDLNKCDVTSYGSYDLQLCATCPWFEAYRECFLQVLYPSDHEFTKHHLACIFVVSSSHADAMDQFTQLTQQQHSQQHQQPNKLPKWFCPNILRYYVLIHDVSQEQQSKAEGIYTAMKNTYGMNNCHLLQINSGGPGSSASEQNIPDPWSKFLPQNRQDEVEVEETESSLSLTQSFTQSNVETEQYPSLQSSGTDINHPLADASDTSHPLSDTNHTDALPLHNHLTDQQPISQIEQNHVTPPHPMTSLSVTNQRGCYLSLSDHDRLRIFIHEFIVRGLIPWTERILRTISEQVLTKKGMGRSILSGAKNWFSGSKRTPQNQLVERPSIVYTSEAPEMQMRRLADLYFMLQLYENAYQTYHQCKRDFNNDHAWLHYAGAMEMASMAILMQGSNSQRQYPSHYMDQAVTTYQNTCKLPNFATRATLLNCEALKSKQLYREASSQYIKMTSEDSDLRSALLLEQAAHCFLKLATPMPRKYTFHMILCGHRFSKAGQRRHALRAYSQALQTYKGKSWSLAEDHINFTIGRQSFNLKQLDNAALAFKHLMSPESKQPIPQQNAFLREYLFIVKQLEAQRSEDGLTQLPLPVVDGNDVHVLTCHPHSAKENQLSATSCSFSSADSDPSATWSKLEQLALVSVHGSLPIMFKPRVQCYTRRTTNTQHPAAVMGEIVSICVYLVNPMKIPLVLSDVTLLWKFLPVHYDDEDSPAYHISNERQLSKNPMVKPEEIVETQNIPEITLQPKENRKLHLTLRPTRTGELHVTGLGYSLGGAPQQAENQSSFINSITVRGKVNLECQGPRLNNTKAEKAGRMYAPDKRLDLLIVPAMPRLEVHFSDFPESVLQGELRRVHVHFTNCGQAPLTRLRLASTHPHVFSFSRSNVDSKNKNDRSSEGTSVDADIDIAYCDKTQSSSEIKVDRPKVKFVETVPLGSNVLQPGESATVEMWLCAPTCFSGTGAGNNLTREYETHLLFYYEPETKHPRSKLNYRLLRHHVQLQVRPSLMLRAVATRRSHTTARDKASRDVNSSSRDVNNSECDDQSCDSSSQTDLLLSLSVQNLNNDTPCVGFRVSHVSTVSDDWTIQRLTHHDNSTEIGRGESSLMTFVLSRSAHAEKVDTKVHARKAIVSSQAFMPVEKHQNELPQAPVIDLHFRAQHPVTFENVEVEPPKAALLPEQTGQVSKTSQVRDVDKLQLSIIVQWQACRDDGQGEGYTLQGQHHVTLTQMGSIAYNPPHVLKQLEQPPVKFTRATDPSHVPALTEAQLARLLQYNLSYTPSVQHDFTRHRLCSVAVRVLCNNISPVDLDLEIDTGLQSRCEQPTNESPVAGADGSISTNQSVPLSQPVTEPNKQSNTQANTPLSRHIGSFVWSSQQVSRIHVKPGTSCHVMLRACFCRPGVYNLSTLQVKAKPTSDLDGVNVPMTLQKSPSPCLIVVSDSRESVS